MAKKITGVVEKVEYTHGGAGNQFTTIGGVRYTTFWDIRTRNWKEGDTVQFTAVERSLWEGQPKTMHAEDITKVMDAQQVAAAAGKALEALYPLGYRSADSEP